MDNFVLAMKHRDDLFFLKGASEEQIESAEMKLELKFSDEYRFYLLAFGVASANGHDFTGICNSPRLNVVDVTLEERKYNPDVPPDYYVVEQANIDGIILWQSQSGKIYQTYPNQPPVQLCNSLFELLEM